MGELTFTTASAEKTRILGEKIGAACSGGEVFLLAGDLGAGKTCLTQGIARGLAVDANVTSPTFVTHMQYFGGRGLALEHFDFYRLEHCDPDNLEFADFFNDPRRVCVVEWPQVIPAILPREHIAVALSAPSPRRREITLAAATARGERWLQLLAG